MLTRWAALVVRRRLLVLLCTLGFVVLAGALGGGVLNRLSAGGYDDSSSSSAEASAILAERFGSGEANLVLLVSSGASVDDPATAAAATSLSERLGREQDVAWVTSYWTAGRPAALRAGDGRQALVLARIAGTEDEVLKRVKTLAPDYRGDIDGLRVSVGGSAQVADELNEQTAKDLAKAEAIIGPITLVVLLIVFGSLVAAALPLAIAAVAIPGTFLVLWLLTQATDVSFLALNMTTGLGLGLAIDYSLLIVSRYRDELALGQDVSGAIGTAMRTAGRTVLFSAVTVAIALVGLLVFPLYFLRSFAYAGIGVTVLAAATALIVLPALLAYIGHRVDRFRLWRRRSVRPVESGCWHRLATLVSRRPMLTGGFVVVLLLLLVTPFFHIKFGLADDRVLPPSAPAHQVSDAIRAQFPAREADPLLVVAPDLPATGVQTLDGYATELSRLPHVARVDAPTGSYAGGVRVAEPSGPSQAFTAPRGTGAYLSVLSTVEPYSDDGRALVRQVRDLPAPSQVLVTGSAARFVDTMSALKERMPYAIAIIVVTTLILLFLLSGSLLMPIKAIVLNMLSLTATFGAMVYVFQDGHLGWLVGDFTATGTIIATVPVLAFCIAFGLSMDYEVFLFSRIHEEYLATGDNTRSVIAGVARTGRLITAAALLVAMVFASFVSSGVTYVKLLGLGMALAVLMDATLIRGVLVPALMRLAGGYNWWAPAPLRRIHARFGISETASPRVAPKPAEPVRVGGAAS
ncbi:MMPL family transporter [Micromonospora tarensis]|uniref:MMPL family transporter n=1 Tax=Micromonospora tarensis TaxID=2806100 RepID=A0ABS1YF03_9ACTN|nr:MMPL family transporter [Micromonospora tarensis]MBM0276005.1 MMPL family transporter [Micromonospora tarensis]